MKNKWLVLAVTLTSSIAFFACNSNNDGTDLIGNWTKKSSYAGGVRTDATCFTIGDTAYVGLGMNAKNERLTTFYKFSSTYNSWTKIADFPGIARNGAVGFSIGTKAYVGTGFDDNDNYLNDFWEYNCLTNTWRQVQSFPGSPRRDAVAFGIGNYGYVGTGFDGTDYKSDFFKYQPADDGVGLGTWSPVKTMEGETRSNAAVFVIAGKAYVVSGTGDSGGNVSDFYMYDPEQNEWIEKRSIINKNEEESYDDDYNSLVGTNEVAFASAATMKGYIVNGYAVWEYDALNDLWSQKSNFEGTSRSQAVGFSISNRFYLTTGGSSTLYSDLWEFKPTEEFDQYN
jgi:N-acetylneuraminic acid mutarotase